MEISFEELQQNYSRKSDEELINIATRSAGGLRPAVLKIIEQELQKRNLSSDILKGAQAQQRQLTLEELETYSSYLRDLPCPVCGDQTKKLNGTIAYTVKSFLVITNYKATPVIACSDCLDQRNTYAMISTAVLGWWGFPWGF